VRTGEREISRIRFTGLGVDLRKSFAVNPAGDPIPRLSLLPLRKVERRLLHVRLLSAIFILTFFQKKFLFVSKNHFPWQ